MRTHYLIILLFAWISAEAQLANSLRHIPITTWPAQMGINSFQNSPTMDAAGESLFFVGTVHVAGGTGSKTISAAGGGKLRWRPGTVTWANAGTNLRVGIQDVAGTGLEDGTFDVYADLVPGTETVTGNTPQSTAMETGSKTVSEGDLIAVGFEMTARAGSDAVVATNISATGTNTAYHFAYYTSDVGSGPVKGGSAPFAISIEFDDGTIGWVSFEAWFFGVSATTSVTSFGLNTTPDEYAVIFKVPYKCSMKYAMVSLASIASTDNFEFVFYTDPLGTPVAAETVTYDPDIVFSTSTLGLVQVTWTTSKTLLPGVWYAVAVRPTTANTITMQYYDLTSGFTKYKAVTGFGGDIKFASRTNQSGAFTETQTYHLPVFSIMIDRLDAGRKEHSSSF